MIGPSQVDLAIWPTSWHYAPQLISKDPEGHAAPNCDQYGVMLLPDDLGYVSLDGTKTAAGQLARAKELLVCQSCIAAGFLHPSD